MKYPIYIKYAQHNIAEIHATYEIRFF